MKKIFLLLLCLTCVLGVTFTAQAAYNPEPCAFVLMGDTSSVTGSVYQDWRRQVRQGYRFPYYEMVDTPEPSQIAVKILAAENRNPRKIEQATLRRIATEAKLKALVLVFVEHMEEERLMTMGGLLFRDGPEDYTRVWAIADMYVYRADTDKMMKKLLYSVETTDTALRTPPEEVIKWELRNLVNRMEGREQI